MAADLQQPGWTAALKQAGLDDSRPICWVAEGLMYYLQVGAAPAPAGRLLRCMRAARSLAPRNLFPSPALPSPSPPSALDTSS